MALENDLPKLPLCWHVKALKKISFCEEPKRNLNHNTFKLIMKKHMRHHGPICGSIVNVCTQQEHGVLFEIVKIKHCWHFHGGVFSVFFMGEYFLPQLEGNR